MGGVKICTRYEPIGIESCMLAPKHRNNSSVSLKHYHDSTRDLLGVLHSFFNLIFPSLDRKADIDSQFLTISGEHY